MKVRYLVAAALLLTGCGGDGEGDLLEGRGNLQEVEVTLEDGTRLRCLDLKRGGQGSIDCDWANPLNR